MHLILCTSYKEGRMSGTDAKIDEYFSLIQDRIVSPIENTEVRQSCTATLLLLFAAIDAGSRDCVNFGNYAEPLQNRAR